MQAPQPDRREGEARSESRPGERPGAFYTLLSSYSPKSLLPKHYQVNGRYILGEWGRTDG